MTYMHFKFGGFCKKNYVYTVCAIHVRIHFRNYPVGIGLECFGKVRSIICTVKPSILPQPNSEWMDLRTSRTPPILNVVASFPGFPLRRESLGTRLRNLGLEASASTSEPRRLVPRLPGSRFAARVGTNGRLVGCGAINESLYGLSRGESS